MPRLNSRGDVLLGAAGGPASVNQQPLPIPAGVACWLTDDLVICQRFQPTGIATIDIRTGQIVGEFPRGCNQLTAGAGRAACADGAGVFGTISVDGYALGLTEQDGRGATGPDGTLAIVKHGGIGFELHAPDGSVFVGPPVIARGLNVLGPTSALWHDDAGQLHGINIDLPVHLSTVASPVVVDIPGDVRWLVSFCSSIGLVAHPWDSLVGVQLTGAGQNAFYPDAKVVNGKLVIVWANGPGELPGDLRRVDDAFALPRQNLEQAPPADPLTPIRKPMWLGFFTGAPGASGGWDTNDDPVVAPPPGNGFLDVPSFKFYSDVTLQPIGSYITGGSVDEIEAAARDCADIPICYWDSRRWPRMPNLPDGAWLCVQAYRNTTEPIANFEADIRSILQQHIAERPTLKHAIVPQCYTSNAIMTTDLKSIVPVVSRLAASLNLHAILPFSGSGRKTGLQDHPEVRPLWEELYSTITGVPDEGEGGNGGTPGGSMDWATIDSYGRQRWAELEVQTKSQAMANGGLDCRPFQQDCFVKIASELCYDKGIPLELFWKAGKPNYDDPASVTEKLNHIGEDILVERPTAQYKDVVVSMGIPSANWNASGGGSPVQGSDLDKCGPPPRLGEPPPPPPSGDVAVLIHTYDATFNRGAPGSEYGMEVVFEAASERPIREAEVYLEDGSAHLVVQFPGELDGRYFRGVRFKPVINGSWTLVVRAKNDQGVWGEARGATPVIVTSIS